LFFFSFQFLHTFFCSRRQNNHPSCFVRFTAFMRSFVHSCSTNKYTFEPSLSTSMSVGRSDGSHSLCARSLFPSSTYATNHECSKHNKSVSGASLPCPISSLIWVHLHPSVPQYRHCSRTWFSLNTNEFWPPANCNHLHRRFRWYVSPTVGSSGKPE
jgi:hypothetical protein